MIVTFTCTNKGQHRTRVLTITGSTLSDLADDESAEDYSGPVPLLAEGRLDRPDGGRTFQTPPCPWCGRHLQLREENWYKLIGGLEAAGLDRVDISYLPMC